MLKQIREDIKAFYDRDPAAKSNIEILLAYPGLHAVLLHRLTHRLNGLGIPILPRVMAHAGRFLTGIEIHPGAKLGRRVTIDHGMGIVIGETAEVGDDVLIYQGVTLGNNRFARGKRHPTIGSNVILGAGASVLGPITVGDGSRIAAGAVVVHDVPDHSTAAGVPAKVILSRDPVTGETRRLAEQQVPDMTEVEINTLRAQIAALEARLASLEGSDEVALVRGRRCA